MPILNNEEPKPLSKHVICAMCKVRTGKSPYKIRLYNHNLVAEGKDHRRRCQLCQDCFAKLCDLLGVEK